MQIAKHCRDGSHFTVESIEVARIKCLTQGHNTLMQSGFEASISAFRNQRPIDMTNMFLLK